MNRRGRPAAGLPGFGLQVPAAALLVAVAVLEFGLSLLTYPGRTGIAVAVLVTVVSLGVPLRLGPWAAIVVIGLGLFTRTAALDWRLFVVLAGLHLLHLFGALAAQLPWRYRLQVRALARPLLRFVAIQVPTQLLALLLLALLAPEAHGHRPVAWAGVGLIGAAAAVGLTLVLLRPLRSSGSTMGSATPGTSGRYPAG